MFLPRNDADHVAARLHGRRSHLTESDRLRSLCDLASPGELYRHVYPGKEFADASAFERRLVQELADEAVSLATAFTGAAGGFLQQFVRRFQIENLKVLLRGRSAGTDFATVAAHLVELPRNWRLPGEVLLGAPDVASLLRLLPDGSLRDALHPWLIAEPAEASPFLIEGLLDRDVHRASVEHLAILPREDRETIAPIVGHETGFFQLMAVLRGRFQLGLPPGQIAPLHVPGGVLSRRRFQELLAASQAQTVIELAGETVFGPGPSPADALQCEHAGRRRLLKLANRAFRQSHLGLGAVAGYLILRRLAVANLILLCHGLRLRVAGEHLRTRLTTLELSEAAHV